MKNLKFLIVGFFAFLSLQSFGQGWEKYINIPNVDSLYGFDVLVDKTIQDDYVLMYSSLSYSKPIMRIDTSGSFNWTQSSGGTLPNVIKNILATNDNYYVTTVDNFGLADIFSLQMNTNGIAVNAYPHVDATTAEYKLFDIIETQDSNFVALLTEKNGTSIDIRLMKFDFDNCEIWSTYPNFNGSISGSNTNLLLKDLKELPNGDLVFAVGHSDFSQNINDLFVIKTNNNGIKINSNLYAYPTTAGGISPYLSVANNGELVLAALKGNPVNPNLIKLDAQLNEVWRTTLWSYGNVYGVLVNADGTIAVIGENNFTGTIKKYDANGNAVWEKTHSYDNYAYAYAKYTHIEPLNSNEYMIFGMVTADSMSFSTPTLYVARLDSNGNIHNQAITGNVYNDLNLDCTLNNSEVILAGNVLVQIAQGTDTAYCVTDSNGNYFHRITAGTYEISAIPLGISWLNCPSQTVTINPFDTITQDLGLRPINTCHDLKVSITIPTLVRCFSNTYTVSYQNLGTQTETGVYVEVELDNFLVVDSTSIPYTSNGNIYTFNIGNLNIGETGEFTIDITVDCNTTILGQAHCVEATIYPNQICLLNSTTWNGATIITNVYCSPNDSVTFELINIGSGDMTQARNYYVIQDQVLPLYGTYYLPQNQDTTFTLAASGYLYQIQAEQEITHPWGNNNPSAITYGCNAGNLITNSLNQLSLNDNLNFTDIDCQQNVGSYDPNDKQGFPTGYGTEHYITKSDKIEYLIRFQNTGTYTAFNVRVEDEIDIATLDLSTLQIQGSSHNYELTIEDGNKLVFNFNNIMLPDSNTNEPESHGFIRFKISQKANNAIGTIIENDAAIYFDFNAPIITNTTFHTVGENFIQVVSTKPAKEKLATVKVFPNPFSEQATFEIETEKNYQNMNLVIYNMMGQAVKTISSNGNNRMILNRDNLTSGVYFYQIQAEDLILDSGKLMLK
jgi:hypothetical protein